MARSASPTERPAPSSEPPTLRQHTHYPFVEGLPSQDVSVPESADAMVAILDTIDAHVDAERLVYVHCWGGVGRTGVVAGCWLARQRGGPEAYDRLQALWRHCPKSPRRRSPETRQQRQYIRDWEVGQ